MFGCGSTNLKKLISRISGREILIQGRENGIWAVWTVLQSVGTVEADKLLSEGRTFEKALQRAGEQLNRMQGGE